MPLQNQNIFSVSTNNCCIFENIYLIIGAQENINNKFGGFYIINLDKVQIIKYYEGRRCKILNCLMNYKENMFICSSIYHIKYHDHKFIRRKLVLYEFNIIKGEKNDELEIRKKSTCKGLFSLINSNSLISDNFIISSFTGQSSLIKIDENKIKYFAQIKIDNPDIIQNIKIKEIEY